MKKPTKQNKLKSRTFWFAVWAAILLTYIVLKEFTYPWVTQIGTLLVSVIAIYIGGNKYVNSKGYFSTSDNPNEEGALR